MHESRRVETALTAAQRGGDRALSLFRTDLTVDTKDGKTDVVTRADRDAQAAVVDAIRETFPDEPVVGEEGEGMTAVPETGPAWIVDPIDGTNNYVRGIRVWATSVAAVIDGKPVAGATVLPALGDTYVAGPDRVTRNGSPITVSDRVDPERMAVAPTIWWDFDRREEYAAATTGIVTRFGDLARFRCAQATLAHVASGALDGTITTVDANPWDTVAGVFMVKQAGGTVTDLDGNPWNLASTGLLASNSCCHDDLLAVASETVAAGQR